MRTGYCSCVLWVLCHFFWGTGVALAASPSQNNSRAFKVPLPESGGIRVDGFVASVTLQGREARAVLPRLRLSNSKNLPQGLTVVGGIKDLGTKGRQARFAILVTSINAQAASATRTSPATLAFTIKRKPKKRRTGSRDVQIRALSRIRIKRLLHDFPPDRRENFLVGMRYDLGVCSELLAPHDGESSLPAALTDGGLIKISLLRNGQGLDSFTAPQLSAFGLSVTRAACNQPVATDNLLTEFVREVNPIIAFPPLGPTPTPEFPVPTPTVVTYDYCHGLEGSYGCANAGCGFTAVTAFVTGSALNLSYVPGFSLPEQTFVFSIDSSGLTFTGFNIMVFGDADHNCEGSCAETGGSFNFSCRKISNPSVQCTTTCAR